MLLVIGACGNAERGNVAAEQEAASYDVRTSLHEDGTGRYYMGREIAQVTGVNRQEWLERPQRETEELPGRVVQALELESDDVVADIGAGTGYFTFRIGPHVPDGLVLAVDIEEEALALIRQKMRHRGVGNVETVLGTVDDPRLPEDSVDVALIVFTYTQFSHPREMMAGIRESLVPGGRVVLVEYRGEDPTIPISPLYTLTEEQARRELEAAGLRWLETRDVLPQHHFMVFEKPVS
jgi:ubiquinone/menaquinone biosynthesis C-methylase UbiE